MLLKDSLCDHTLYGRIIMAFRSYIFAFSRNSSACGNKIAWLLLHGLCRLLDGMAESVANVVFRTLLANCQYISAADTNDDSRVVRLGYNGRV